MRILLLWTYYENYLRQFYLHNPSVSRLPFADQKQLLLEDGFLWPAHMIDEFRKIGHEADIVVGNADPAQATWALENGLASSTLRADIVREQIRSYRPDILWTCCAERYRGEFLRSVRDDCGAVVGWSAEFGAEQFDWSGVDCVLSSHSNFVQAFRDMGLRSELVLPCVNPKLVADCLSATSHRTRDVTFYGTLAVHLFKERLKFLSAITRHVQCDIYADRMRWRRRPWPPRSFLAQFRYVPFRLRNRFKPPVFGRDLLRLIASSKIVLNAHVDAANGLAGNIRMFEVTAMGALLLTDPSPNISELFEPDKEIVTYENAADAVKKLRHYLSRPEELQAIAAAGQERTLRSYNCTIRAGEVMRIFSDVTRS